MARKIYNIDPEHRHGAALPFVGKRVKVAHTPVRGWAPRFWEGNLVAVSRSLSGATYPWAITLTGVTKGGKVFHNLTISLAQVESIEEV